LSIETKIEMASLLERSWSALLVRGLATVLCGVIAFARSGAGAPAVISLIASYALFVRVILMILAFRMRGRCKQPERLGAT
jgi:uncharacterized membrane protein HdeD (DUF308 family)